MNVALLLHGGVLSASAPGDQSPVTPASLHTWQRLDRSYLGVTAENPQEQGTWGHFSILSRGGRGRARETADP